jgi:ADP-ribose diphosphatase
MAYELLNRDYIYRGRIFDVSVGRFQSAGRGEVSIEVIHHTGGAGALPLFEDGSIALIRQWRYSVNRYLIEIPAGRIEPGQIPEETAARELEEETGYRAGKIEKLAEFYVAPGYCEEKIHVYLATGLTQSVQNLDHDEEIEVLHLSLDRAIQMIKSGDIDDAKTVIALMMAVGAG